MIDQMTTSATKYLTIKKAGHISGHKICLRFNDGTETIVDFGPFLRKSRNPEITQFRELTKFKKFRIEHGNLMWGDFEMIFPIADLHEGKV